MRYRYDIWDATVRGQWRMIDTIDVDARVTPMHDAAEIARVMWYPRRIGVKFSGQYASQESHDQA